MTTTSTTEYRVVNEIGRVVQTFDGARDKERAKRFALSERDRLGELSVVEVTTTVQTRRVYRPRPVQSVSAGIQQERAMA